MTGFKSKKEMAMSKVKDLYYDVETLFIEGYGAKAIATQLSIPLETVYEILADFGVSAEDVVEKPQDYYGA